MVSIDGPYIPLHFRNFLLFFKGPWPFKSQKTHFSGLKVPKCEIFDPFFFTSVNPIWVGDLSTGEKKIFVRRLRQIFAILFFLRMLSLR